MKRKVVPAKVRQTFEEETGLLGSPAMIWGHCSDQKPSSGSWKVSWLGIATPEREQSLWQTS